VARALQRHRCMFDLLTLKSLLSPVSRRTFWSSVFLAELVLCSRESKARILQPPSHGLTISPTATSSPRLRVGTRCSTSCCDRSSPGTSSSPPPSPPREVDLVPEKQRQQHLLSRLLVIELSLAHAGASSPSPSSPTAPPAAVARHRTPFSAGEDHVWFKDRWMVASLCDE
jgi:hypothetical protein